MGRQKLELSHNPCSCKATQQQQTVRWYTEARTTQVLHTDAHNSSFCLDTQLTLMGWWAMHCVTTSTKPAQRLVYVFNISTCTQPSYAWQKHLHSPELTLQLHHKHL